MCRHIGYIGKKKNLNSILLNHSHSLIELAYKPKEMKNATLNADGFGIAWKNKNNFDVYKNNLPIWNDLNLKSISKSVYSNLVIGNVRSATNSEYLGYYNTHPFNYNNYCFSHNGYIEGFNVLTKKKILKYLNEKFYRLLKGNTDSELIFILLMQFIENSNNVTESIRAVIEIVENNFSAAMLNFLLAVNKGDKNYLFATKYSKFLKTPTLYYTQDKNQSFTISSEKLNSEKWYRIKNQSIVKVFKNSIIMKSL